MARKRDPSLVADRRVILVGIGGVVVGFLLAALIFGKPWHLPPAWGDIPTWLTTVVGGAAAWFVLGQLRQQQAVIEEDRERGRKRDELLDGQLREMDDRERERRREQAEKVTLTDPYIRKGASGQVRRMLEQKGPLARGSLPFGSIKIFNSSARPIRHLVARLVIDGTEILADDFVLSGCSRKFVWVSGSLREVGLLPGVLLLVFADAAEQVLEVVGGVFPAERLGGLVVAVHECEQGFG